MIVIPWQIFPFGIAFGAVALLGSACCWPTQVPLARSVVAGRQPTGTRYVERPREQPGMSAAKLKDYTRALSRKYDLTVDQIALDAIKSRFAELT